MLKMLDLFAGIGGFSLAGHWTGGIKTVAFCEISPFPQRVLKKNFPGVPIYDDVQQLTADRLHADGIDTVDIITGGFPCQDLSSAGAMRGFNGDRSSLFREMLRLYSELRPRYIIFENVSNLVTGNNGQWFYTFLCELAQIGLHAEWHCIPAAAIGATHGRDRVWIVAYSDKVRQRIMLSTESQPEPRGYFFIDYRSALRKRDMQNKEKWPARMGQKTTTIESCVGRVADGIPNRDDRVAALGNSIVPQVAYPILKTIVDIEQS